MADSHTLFLVKKHFYFFFLPYPPACLPASHLLLGYESMSFTVGVDPGYTLWQACNLGQRMGSKFPQRLCEADRECLEVSCSVSLCVPEAYTYI